MISSLFLAGQKLPGRFLGFGDRCHGGRIRRACSRPFSWCHFGLRKRAGGCGCGCPGVSGDGRRVLWLIKINLGWSRFAREADEKMG